MRRERGGRDHGWVIDADPGWIRGVRRVASPNCDARPAGTSLDLIVLHGISLPPGQFGGPWIDRLFTNTLPMDAHPYFATIADRKLSAHALVRRDGSLTQYVPFLLRAWHAGASSYEGRSACNDFSVGIELEGTDDTVYEDAQYTTASALIGTLCAAYPTLSSRRLVGHSDIAPGRKTDPGIAFDWPRLRAGLVLREQAP